MGKLTVKSIRAAAATRKGRRAARGWSARLNKLKALQNETSLQKCDEMLTKAGVPEWVINSDSNGVPGNSVPCRLKWYLARRKDVKPGEIDQRLQRDMNKWLLCVKRHSNSMLDNTKS